MAILPGPPVSPLHPADTAHSPLVCDETLTVCAISALAFIVTDTLHQSAHALIGSLTVSPFSMLTSAGWSSAYDNTLTDAAGPLVSLAAAAIFWLLLRSLSNASAHIRLFLLLGCAFSLLQVTSLLFFSGATGFGDWASILGEPRHLIVWLAVLVFAGALTYRLTLSLIGLGFTRYLGVTDRRRLFRLALAASLSAIVISVLAAAMNRIGLKFLALSEFAPTLLASMGLLWVRRYIPRSALPLRDAAPLTRSWPWIAVAGIAAAAFVLVLGRGITLTGQLQ
jgi:hypothetical protein